MSAGKALLLKELQTILTKANSANPAEAGPAKLSLAKLYSRKESHKALGMPTEKTGFVTARQWCEESIKLGHTPAKTELAVLLESEYKHFDLEKKEAIKLARKNYYQAAKEGEAAAQNNLGNLYILNYKLLGINKLKAVNLAYKWIAKALPSEKEGEFTISKNLAQICSEYYWELNPDYCCDILKHFMKKIQEAQDHKNTEITKKFTSYFRNYIHGQRSDVLVKSIDNLIDSSSNQNFMQQMLLLNKLVRMRDNGPEITEAICDEKLQQMPALKKFLDSYKESKEESGGKVRGLY
jgi:hypothetical protein